MSRHLLPLMLFTALGVSPSAGAAAIAQADATVVLVPDSSGRFTVAQVTETVTPDPGPRPKAISLSQSLSPWHVQKPIVLGSNGHPLPFDFDPVNGRLSWNLPVSEEGPVTVRFSASPIVQETPGGNRLRLDWLTRWQGPVTGHLATILFPQGFVPQNVNSTWDALPGARPVQQVALGVQALRVDVTKAPPIPLVVSFTPKLVSVVTVLYALFGALVLLAIQTTLRLSRVPHLFRKDPRDPTPTELAYLCSGETEAVVVSHLDLELQNGLLRGGDDCETVHAETAQEPYEQFILAYYQIPRPLQGFFQAGCIHYESAVGEIRRALHRKGLLLEIDQRRQCGWDLLGFWAVATAFLSLIVFAVQPWSQEWVRPWLTAGGASLAAFLALPVYFLVQEAVTPLAHAKVQKYEALLQEGIHTRDEVRGYRLQLAYGAAYKGIDWLDGALPEEQLAVYRSVLPAADTPPDPAELPQFVPTEA